MAGRGFGIVFLLMFAASCWAQGQDGTRWERDLQVITEMLAGSYNNTNQVYFDFRTGSETPHSRLHVDVTRVNADALGSVVFHASAYRDGNTEKSAGNYLWVLSADSEANAVRMSSRALDAPLDVHALPGAEQLLQTAHCELLWRREAAQFRAETDGQCDLPLPRQLVLSERQLWLYPAAQDSAAVLHRVRPFECYVDIPGVGGGAAIPYERYEGFRIHDQGGSFSFTSKEGQQLSVSLLLVDWPINNYKGVFTRDSLVLYVNEQTEDGRKEHGYAFTVPEADRIGINLKWMLAFCYMQSNADATPSM